jgi:peptide-methionine (S)-S-oxide reductase
MQMHKIGFGGGCHWCTEAIFQALHGVGHVRQGWISSLPPFDAFSEAVIVHFNDTIGLADLIAVHLLTHSSAADHSMRQKYRSAVYFFEENDRIAAETAIERLAKESGTDYITQVLPFADFRENTEDYRDYYRKNKAGPFCKTYIDPKLTALRRKFGKQVRNGF